MENKPEYYECIKTSDPRIFTVGELYKINNPNNLEDAYNFTNNNGIQDGWSGANYKYFKPVYNCDPGPSNIDVLCNLLKQIAV